MNAKGGQPFIDGDRTRLDSVAGAAQIRQRLRHLLRNAHRSFDDQVETLLLCVGDQLLDPLPGIAVGVIGGRLVVLPHQRAILRMVGAKVIANDCQRPAAALKFKLGCTLHSAFPGARLAAKDHGRRPIYPPQSRRQLRDDFLTKDPLVRCSRKAITVDLVHQAPAARRRTSAP